MSDYPPTLSYAPAPRTQHAVATFAIWFLVTLGIASILGYGSGLITPMLTRGTFSVPSSTAVVSMILFGVSFLSLIVAAACAAAFAGFLRTAGIAYFGIAAAVVFRLVMMLAYWLAMPLLYGAPFFRYFR